MVAHVAIAIAVARFHKNPVYITGFLVKNLK